MIATIGMTDRGLPRLYIDTNIFIGAFESDSGDSKNLRQLFFDLENNPGWAATSELTLAELAAHGLPTFNFYLGLLVSNTFITLLPTSRETLVASGTYRHRCRQIGRGVKLPDAIHVMTADLAGCDFLLSADRRLFVPETISLLAPQGEDLAIIKKALDA